MQRFKNILVAVDTEVPQSVPLDHARDLAIRNGAKLKLVDVVQDFSLLGRKFTPDYQHVMNLLAGEKQAKLEQVADALRKQGIEVTTRVLHGSFSTELIREVLRDGHDLVVKMKKGTRSRRQGSLGTTAIQLLRRCPCAVWLTHPDHPGPCDRVLAAVDANPEDQTHMELNRLILDLALSLGETGQCEVHVVYAWSIFYDELLKSRMKPEKYREIERQFQADQEASLAELMGPYKDRIPEANIHLGRGEATEVIPRLAADLKIDSIVMGTVARAGAAGWFMGNTAEVVLDQVECSVVAVKPADFVSPITLED